MAYKKPAGTNPEPQSPEQDAKVKAERKAQELRDKRKANFSSAHNTQAQNKALVEEQLNIKYSVNADINAELASAKATLKSSGKFAENGEKIKLSGLEKEVYRNKIINLKESSKIVQREIAELEQSLKGSLKKDTNRIKRANVRKSAKKDAYHNRHGASIEKALDRTINGFKDEQLSVLKAEVTKAEFKVGDAIMMKAILNETRFLHTRVVSNPEARKGYLQHFRGKLTGSKGKSRKK